MPVLSDARATFVRLVQCILDVLFDVTRHSHKGAANFPNIGLCFWAVDELLVAMHLAQRAFTTHTYTHIRTVLEIRDLIELFQTQPKWVDLWVSGDDRKAWSELKPSKVRQTLGGPHSDPIYSFFSQLGPHGTFRGLRARAAMLASPDTEHTKHFRLWVGGSPMAHHIVWTNSFCIYAALITLVKSIGAFADYLNAAETDKVIVSVGELSAQFYRKHFAGWAREQGINPQPLLDLLDKAPWKDEVNS